MTITPSGDIILSLHQFYRPVHRVVKIPEGTAEAVPFPNDPISRGAQDAEVRLDSVQGIQCDRKGVVWMLDNGRRGESNARIVAWNDKRNELHKLIQLPPECVRVDSFVNDLVFVPDDPSTIFISDPAGGNDAALIVLDVETGMGRRVLEGDISVRPMSSELIIDGNVVAAEGLDGVRTRPQFGVNSLTIDRKGKWLYFAALNSDILYRVDTKLLKDKSLKPAELAARVERYARKPHCDGISIDRDDNIYVTDLRAKAIGVIDSAKRRYRLLVADADFEWPDGLCYADNRFYFYTNQLHRSAFFSKEAPSRRLRGFHLFEFKGLASGIKGN